ncbi:transketolase [Thermodesulforhabdus norvegica]|uniref:Transketolase n=1 Tax=Thermodesulforhabdus norvegica TaxID=39841 RepID=A0A1I4SSF5_9BACT|nr:transketolase [Thermodesulforhabdus norvegica]SFM67335.1 transketolase [Thermodesulforhabdus norvegica]
MMRIDYHQDGLTEEQKAELNGMWRRCVRRILAATTLAGSGHPGGSMSSLHTLLLLYSMANHRPDNPAWEDRDRIVVSMGHISPGVYSVLCEFGYVKEEEFLLEFRRTGSAFGGHVEHYVPGVEWNTGNLGQGLSAGTGMALAEKLKKTVPSRVFVLMGDGEQQKGQIAEARRFAVKYGLSNLVGIVDRNHLQIGGKTECVMPQRVRDEYRAAGWNVIYVEDGNDFDQLFAALRRVFLMDVDDPSRPTVIVARTVMGKGVSFMENNEKYHGMPLSEEEAARAFQELGMENPIPELKKKLASHRQFRPPYHPAVSAPTLDTGVPRTYGTDVKTDNRSAYGAALEDLARLNNSGPVPRILGFSCDLEGSVKMTGFRKACERAFYECGIQEHHAATVSGAISREGFVVFFSTFGVFGVCETYNQHRLNDMNGTWLKVVCTHLGLDVGEDGPTHQCIDYVGLLRNLFGWSIFIPADPNQTDRIVRLVANMPGNVFVGMGRSRTPVITDTEGRPFFGGDYTFVPGKADWIRRGSDAAILTYGSTVAQAVEAWQVLKDQHGIECAVVNCASIKPFDTESVIRASETGLIVTVEDHNVETGLGAIVASIIAEEGLSCRFIRLGVHRYGQSGKPIELYREQGIDSRGIIEALLEARQKGWLAA